MNKPLQYSLRILTITTIIISFLSYLESPNFSIFLIFLSCFFFISIPNLVFLFLISLLNIRFKMFLHLKFLIVEVILLFLSKNMVQKLIVELPNYIKFENTYYNSMRVKFYLLSPFIEFYSFLFLFLILFLLIVIINLCRQIANNMFLPIENKKVKPSPENQKRRDEINKSN
jgi:hypothetical protein